MPEKCSCPRSESRPQRRGARLAARALMLLGLGLAGCGGVAVSTANSPSQLTIYSSLPLQGPSAAVVQQIVDGEKLALAESGGRVGPFRIYYDLLDDSNPKSGAWDPGMTANDAKTAAQDKTTIAYLGDYNSGATAISLPLVNAAGILQISPGSSYVGLTSSLNAGQDEPDRFYPTGQRTFGRLVPSDQVQGAAQVHFMSGLGVHTLYVIEDQNPFDATLASIVANDARQAGMRVVATDTVDTGAADFSGEAKKVAASGADAVFFGGGPAPGTVRLWQQLYAGAPSLKLFGSSAMAESGFTGQLGGSARNTYMTTPMLAPGLYPPAAQRFFSSYRRLFGITPGPEVLYGYEAMKVVLLAIQRAGARGNDRQTVVRQFFAIRDRDSVLGRYSIQRNGDTTLTDYAVDRVVHGRPVFDQLVHVALPALG